MKTFLPSLRKSLILQVLILATLLPGLTLFTVPLQANPSGASVVHGNVAFNGLGTSQLNITQGSQNAIINWQSFSIQSGETTTFIQPNQSSVALNRVVGVDPTAIYGTLNANGGVIVINPNGILVGPGGRIDVAGMLTMSTLDIDDNDFLDGGPMRFRGNTEAGIRNYGAISSSNGDVVLLGNFLQNAGEVSSATGTVAFGAGGDIVVNETSNGGKISVLAGGIGGDTGIENAAAGEIHAAAAELKAHGNVYALAIKNDGLVRADGYNFSGGRLTLSGGSRSSVVNTGTLYARNSNGSGGRVEISGGNVSLTGGTVNASGAAGMDGGSVSVAGETVNVGNGAGVDVSGVSAGTVDVTGVSSATVDGTLAAVGSGGAGGSVDVTAASVLVGAASQIDASGSSAGGSVRIGGGFQGSEADIENADSVVVEEGSLILADSSEGDAGRVIVWADVDTTFRGEISAAATGQVGNGGFVEVSGKENLSYLGLASTASANGQVGTLLLDPTDFIIDATGTNGTTGAALIAQLLTTNVIIQTDTAGTEQGNIVLESGQSMEYDSPNSLTLLAINDVIINDDIQNEGEGNVNVFAGWDGTTFNAQASTTGDTTNFLNLDAGGPSTTVTNNSGQITFEDIATTKIFGDWGTGGGNVIVNGAGTNAVSVGSAGGETNLFGDQVSVRGGSAEDRFGQVGFRPTRALLVNEVIDGDINIRANNDIRLSSIDGDPDGGGEVNAFVLIGHGGTNSFEGNELPNEDKAFDNDVSGNISVISQSGDVFMLGGGNRSYVQIGHGGRAFVGDKDGDITVTGRNLFMRGAFLQNGAAGNNNNAGTRIGHGGFGSHGSLGGTVRNDGIDPGADLTDGIDPGELIAVADFGKGFSGDIIVNFTGSIQGSTAQPNAVAATNHMIQFGHGGWASGATDETGMIRDSLSYLHGESGSTANSQLQDDVITAVDMEMEGHTGDITVTVGSGGIDLTMPALGSQFIRFGHGGFQSHGNHDGNVTIASGGDISLQRGINSNPRVNDNSPIQLGHGGVNAVGAFTGDVSVTASGSFEMHGGTLNSYAQIGHGGVAGARQGGNGTYRINDNTAAHATLSGHITVNVTGDFEIYSGMGEDNAYAMVGHGGTNRTAFGIVNRDDHASTSGSGSGLVDETERGHHGNISITAGGDVIVRAEAEDPLARFNDVSGNNNFAQIGHGGVRSAGDHYGEVTVEATNGNASFRAGPGGWETFRPNRSESATQAENTTFNDFQTLETGINNYVMLGHGGVVANVYSGRDTSNNQFMQDNGNTEGVGFGNTVNAAKGITNSNITLISGTGVDLVASQEISNTRNDQVPVAANELLLGSLPSGTVVDPSIRSARNFALIGHGGTSETNANRDINATAVSRGDITITTGGHVDVFAGGVQQDDSDPSGLGVDSNDFVITNFAFIGHGGNQVESSQSGNINVTAGTDINLRGGNALEEAARIGHGGYESGVAGGTNFAATTFEGEINVTALGSISLVGGGGINRDNGNSAFSSAQIGHGANQRASTVTADITVTAGRDVFVSGGVGFQDSYAHIGHGALANASGLYTGTIDVTAGDDITVQSTTGLDVGGSPAVRNYAKIGHGDTDTVGRGNSAGTWNGDVLVKAGNDLRSFGGVIGHIDPTDQDDLNRSTAGNTFIAVGRDDPFSNSGILLLTEAPSERESIVTSSGLGNFGSELRFYVPSPAVNSIGEGTILNNNTELFGAYDPFDPTTSGNGRPDEAIATEFTFVTVDGLPTGTFGAPPEGNFQPALGAYTVYLADDAPIVIPEDGAGGGPLFPTGPFDFFPFFFEDQFDSFIRGELVYFYDGYEGQLFSFGIEDAIEGEEAPEVSGWFLEEIFDGALGPRRNSTNRTDNALAAEENSEELIRRKEFAARQVGRGGFSFYVFDPSTSQYSSYRVFGIPQSGFSVAE